MENTSQPPIPSNYIIGKVFEDEDSFFCSIAQCLKQIKKAKTNSQELWQKCQKHVKELLESSHAFDYQPSTIYGKNVKDYLSHLEKGVKGPPNCVRSRPEPEGRIICNVFNVNIHILNKPDHDNINWWHSIVSRFGENEIIDTDYESIDTIHVIHEGDLRFKPILKKITRDDSDHDGTIETYDTRKGARGAGGHFYEIKLLMLFYLRLQLCDEFYLATNLANVGAFDDVVFKYKNSAKGIIEAKLVFLQAKHSDNPKSFPITIDGLMSPIGQFSLKKYFDSYKTIKRNFQNATRPLFEGNFTDCTLIIFSNSILEPNDSSRWIENTGDEVVVGKGCKSQQLNPDAKINQDIINKLCCHKLREIAQEIYNYTLGEKKGACIRGQNMLQPYEIVLANQAFTVNKQHPNKSKFSETFHETTGLWEEFCQIAGNPENETFKENLKAVTINLHKTFGKHEQELDETSRNKLMQELVNIIKCSSSYNIEIRKPPKDINKLANCVLVGVKEEGSKNSVKFCDNKPSDDAQKFMNNLTCELEKANTKITDLDIMKIRFRIEEFPILSLPRRDDVVTEAEVKEFLTKLEFVLGQKNETELDGLIKDEITETCRANDEEREAIFGSVKSKVESWWKYSNSYLKKDTKFVVEAQTSLSQIQLTPFQDIGRKGIDINKVQFKDTIQGKLLEIILSHKVLNIVAENGTSILSSVKICQTLDRAYKEKSYIYMRVHHLLNIKDHVLEVFKSERETPYFLVIESNRQLLDRAKWVNEETIRSFYDRVFQIVENSTDKHVVLITETGDATHFDCNVTYFRKISENMNLDSLTNDSQQRILNNKITLQGIRVKINELIPECNDQFKEEITSKLLMNLINTNIGNAPQRISESEAAFTSFYDPMPKENLVKMIEQPEDDTMIVISGIKGLDIELLIKFLGNEDTIAMRVNERISDGTIIIPHENSTFDMKGFKQICANNYEKTVYWVAVNLELLHLQQVFYPHFYVKRDFIRYKYVLKPEILCQDNAPDIRIFCNSAGQDKVAKCVHNLEERCISHFNTHCYKGTIIFPKDSQDASTVYESMKRENNSVHWLKITDSIQFKWHKSNGPRPKYPNRNPVFESDLFIQESNPHVFIFSDLQDQMKVMDMIKQSCSQRTFIFHNNCTFGRTKFIDEGDVMETIEPVKQTSHSLKVEEGGNAQLMWSETRGSILQLRDFIDEDKCEQELHTEDTMSKLQENVVIIADEPGMGKTTSLTSVSQQMLNSNWVIRINFLDCEHAIDSIKESELSAEDVYNFVSKVESTGLRNDWAKQLMKHKLTPVYPNTWPILFLFDGFDEISKERQLKILPFLQFIKYQTAARLWVTTRFHTMDTLENGLSAFAITFQELSKKDRLGFLNSSWAIRLSPFLRPDNFKQRTEKYSLCLLENVSDILGNGFHDSLGVPMQLRLLSEALRQDYVKFINSGDDHPPNFSHVNVLYVYSHFIKERYEIYMKDKNRLNVNESLKLPIFRSFDKNHETLAFNLLFREHDTIKPKGLSVDEDMLKSVGIIQSMGVEGKPYFLHRTFAEYFVAKLLFRYIRKKESNPKKFKSTTKFINSNIFQKSNFVIQYFINHMSIEPNKDFPIHFATFRNNMKYIIWLMKDTTNRQNCDKFGRTPLHIAAREGHLNVAKVLLDCGCDAIAQDVLGKTALHYAVMKGHQDVVAHILNYTADIKICDNIFAKPLHIDMEIGDSIFQEPRQLNSKLVTLTNTEDFEGKAALYYATEIKDWEIAGMLIALGANISSQTNETSMEILKCKTREDFISFKDFNDFTLLLLMLKSIVPEDRKVLNDAVLKCLWMGHTKVLHAVRGCLSELEISNILDTFAKRPEQMERICDEDHLKVAKYLMQERNEELMANTLAKVAARLGNLETLKYVIDQGHTDDYISYMKCAIEGHSLNIVEHLERSFSCDNDGNTALHLAARVGSLEIVKYLLENNEDVKALNNEKQTPLDIANRIVKPYLRIKSNSDSDKPQDNSRQQSTPENVLTSTSNPFTDCFSNTGQYAANDTIQNVSFSLSYRNAIPPRISKDEIAEYFLKFPEGYDENRVTKCHLAAYIDDIDELESFTGFDAFENPDNNGHTPLHYAVKNDQIKVVKFLLIHHAKFNPKCKKGKTPLDIATGKSEKFLQEIQVIFNIFQNEGSNVESLKSMQLENKDCFIAAINCRDDYGNALLGYAASANDIDSVLFILRNGGSFELCPMQQGGKEVSQILTSFYHIIKSIEEEYEPAPRYMTCFDKYSDIADVRYEFNQNFFHKIADRDGVIYYMLNYLVEHGANINAIDRFNKSVITSAIDSKNLDLVKFLLYKGVNIKDLDPDSKRRLFDCANEKGRPDITDLFETLMQNSEQVPE